MQKKILANVKDSYITKEGGMIPIETAKHHEQVKEKVYYEALEKAGIYEQLIINPFVGFSYKSNIKENQEFYQHFEGVDISVTDKLGEKNLASNEMIDNYQRKATLNTFMGTPMFGWGGMNNISVEERDLVNFSMYDRAIKLVYLAKASLLGFGEKTMHAPM